MLEREIIYNNKREFEVMLKKIFNQLNKDEIVLNRGCGVMYLQRGKNKIAFDKIPHDSWFIKEKLCNKIAYCLPWSVLEPEEGNYQWKHPDWEGSMDSWIAAGYKVALQIRGQDTWGTFYNEGVPQWVFDAGAKYIDEPIRWYKGGYGALNFMPDGQEDPMRYPVYWDEIYLDKVELLVNALGERYNGRPEVEYIILGHLGRWGEMHITGHSPLEPWFDAGYSLEKFIETNKRIIDIYCNAFPDTQIVQEICAPCYAPEEAEDLHPVQSVPEIYEYMADKNIIMKSNGIGYNWHEGSSLYWDKNVADIFRKHVGDNKVSIENLVLSEALQEGLDEHISYWQRGGESTGLGILNIDRNIPINEKKIYSFYNFYKEAYDKMSIEDEKNIWRRMASQCAYRIALVRCQYEELISGGEFKTLLTWENSGQASCYEKFQIRIALTDKSGNEVWSAKQPPSCACSAEVWGHGKRLENSLTWKFSNKLSKGTYQLQIGLQHELYGQEMFELTNTQALENNMYVIGDIII